MNNKFVTHVEDVQRFGIIKAVILGRLRFWSQWNELYNDWDTTGFITSIDLSNQTGLDVPIIDRAITEMLNEGILIEYRKRTIYQLNYNFIKYFDYDLAKTKTKQYEY